MSSHPFADGGPYSLPILYTQRPHRHPLRCEICFHVYPNSANRLPRDHNHGKYAHLLKISVPGMRSTVLPRCLPLFPLAALVDSAMSCSIQFEIFLRYNPPLRAQRASFPGKIGCAEFQRPLIRSQREHTLTCNCNLPERVWRAVQ